MNPEEQGNNPMGNDLWATANDFFGLGQSPNGSYIDWNNVLAEPEPTPATVLPAATQTPTSDHSHLQTQLQGQPALQSHVHHQALYQQQGSQQQPSGQQQQQPSLPQPWHNQQESSQPQSHLIQEPSQPYQLLPQYQIHEQNQFTSPYDAQSQHSLSSTPVQTHSLEQVQGQQPSYHNFALDSNAMQQQPPEPPQRQQSQAPQFFESIQISVPSQKPPLQQQMQPSPHGSFQQQHASVEASRSLPQLAPAPIRNPMSQYDSRFRTLQARQLLHTTLHDRLSFKPQVLTRPSQPDHHLSPSPFSHQQQQQQQQQHQQQQQQSQTQPSPQPQQVQQGQHKPYYSTINPQYLAPSQAYGHAHDFVMVNPAEVANQHHTPQAQPSTVPLSANPSQMSMDHRYQPQQLPSQTPSQQTHNATQFGNNVPNMIWSPSTNPMHRPLQPCTVQQQPQQLQPYGGTQHQMQPPVLHQAQLEGQAHGQAKVDPALSLQQMQGIQQQHGQQFYNLTVANSQGQKQNGPVATDFQIQIPVKNVKPPKNGTIVNLDTNQLSVPRKKKDTTTPAATKTKSAQPRKSIAGAAPGAIVTLDGSSSSDYSTDDSSDSDAENAVAPEPSPISPTRPSDPKGAARYDAIKAVWAPRNRRTVASVVRKALVTFSDLVKGMRDSFKSKTEALKEADSKKDEAKVKELKDQVEEGKQVFSVVLKAAMEWGHPAVIRRLGEHPYVMASLYSFLLDRHTAGDNDGPLTVDILKFMTRFTTIDQAILEKTKVSKILPRFVKKGGDITKKLAQQVLDNAAAESKRKSEAKTKSATSASTASTVREGKAAASRTVQTARQPPSAKREREYDEILSSTKRSAQSYAKRPKLPSTTQRGGQPYTGTAGKTAAITPAAPKSTTVQKPVAPTSIFSSLVSASKKPGTSNAARAAAAAAAKDKGEQKKPSSTSKTPGFSFKEAMALLDRPKDAVPEKRDVKPKLNETEEERAARLKKEKKRRLRVSFKPDNELVEVRLFTHDPEEEIRADPNMVKDVADVGGEGQMLKLHLGEDDLDEDDEVGEMKEEDFRPWPTLLAIDFNVLPEKERSANFIKFGGTQIPDSAEKLAQEKREATSLPPLRTSFADIPESPKELPALEEEEAKKERPEPAVFGEPGDLVKARSDKYFESREVQTSSKSPPTGPAAANTAPTNNLSSLLGLLQGGQQGTNATSAQSNPLVDLEKTFNQFRAPTAIPTAPAALRPQAQAQAPMFNALDINKIFAVINASQQMGTAVPVMPMQQQGTPDANAILSQLSSVTGLSQAQAPNTNSGYNATPNTTQVYEHEDRKRLREEGFSNDNPTKRTKNDGKRRGKRRGH
ncbi:hypothetical protein KEM56_000015 [Ascosphaera pollenicola]|nr:hypothetical protein KEM56_000015 [Ascosphaera pollenicola]